MCGKVTSHWYFHLHFSYYWLSLRRFVWIPMKFLPWVEWQVKHFSKLGRINPPYGESHQADIARNDFKRRNQSQHVAADAHPYTKTQTSWLNLENYSTDDGLCLLDSGELASGFGETMIHSGQMYMAELPLSSVAKVQKQPRPCSRPWTLVCWPSRDPEQEPTVSEGSLRKEGEAF